jgi:hypothetical protein
MTSSDDKRCRACSKEETEMNIIRIRFVTKYCVRIPVTLWFSGRSVGDRSLIISVQVRTQQIVVGRMVKISISIDHTGGSENVQTQVVLQHLYF